MIWYNKLCNIDMIFYVFSSSYAKVTLVGSIKQALEISTCLYFSFHCLRHMIAFLSIISLSHLLHFLFLS